jgi:hypothetical protein
MVPRKMRAARTKVITAMVAPLSDGLADARDRTLLLFGFAGALRRSELVALDIEDVSEDDDGLLLVVRRSKTDQEAEGAIRGLPYGSHPATCPVRAWRGWLTASGITTGPAFRSVDRHGRLGAQRLSDRAVADMIKRRARAAGLDGAFAGHSLRAGFATEGCAQGTPELAIMRHGRWRSASVMRGYIEEAPSGTTTPPPGSGCSRAGCRHENRQDHRCRRGASDGRSAVAVGDVPGVVAGGCVHPGVVGAARHCPTVRSGCPERATGDRVGCASARARHVGRCRGRRRFAGTLHRGDQGGAEGQPRS